MLRFWGFGVSLCFGVLLSMCGVGEVPGLGFGGSLEFRVLLF